MRRLLALSAAAVAFACTGTDRSDAPVAFDSSRALVQQAPLGAALAPPEVSRAAALGRYLKDQGASALAVASVRSRSEHRSERTGLTHARFEQEVGGLRVAGAYVKATFDARGALVHVVRNDVPVSGAVSPAVVTEGDALRAALALLHPSVTELPAAAKRNGNVTTFERIPFFHEAPTVERVAIAMRSGALRGGFLVETWTARDNLLNVTTVDGDGKVIGNELRTNQDRYRVFPIDPVKTPQEIVDGPGAGNAESPRGWLLGGPQRSIDIAGNNVHAYLDAVPDGAPDAGGTTILDGDFLALADLTVSPAAPTNLDVAVQNLFFLSNVVHDTLYRHGFTETAGNFQENDFGRSPHDRDAVRAEAQDGAGTDNANFATPPDGRPPRMQMFLWTGKGDHQVVVDAPSTAAGTYRAQGAAFGPALSPAGVSGGLVLVDDGTGGAGVPTDGCEPPANDVTGRIALVDRGNCLFTVKVKNAQVAGAVAVIVANNAGDSIFTMGGADPTITIPSVLIGRSDGQTIRAGLTPTTTGTVRRTDPPPLRRDGDLDSDIVWHEYGHGLTWRMIGQMQGPLSGAVGEGMSDVLAILANEDDVVAEYAFDDPAGIRRNRYQGYPRTYGAVQGTEVHNDGEVYAAIGWRLFEIYRREGISKDVLLDDLIDGMNFTPGSPKFEDMRDGILASIAAAGSGRACLVWEAFARFGVGVGAFAQAPNGRGLSGAGGPATPPVPTVRVVESFAVPAECATPAP